VRIQFETADLAGENVLEVGIDDLEIKSGGTIAGNGFPARFFAPYVDTLLYPPFSLTQTAAQTGQKFYTLAFITADGCAAKWGGT